MSQPETHNILIGRGNVGLAYYQQSLGTDVEPDIIITSEGIHDVIDKSDMPGALKPREEELISELAGRVVSLVIAMPSIEGGETESGYIDAGLCAGAKVVTAAKGALSTTEGFAEIKKKSKNFTNFGYAASVGGDVPVLSWIEAGGYADPYRSQTMEVHINTNGTFGFVLNAAATKYAQLGPEQAFEAAVAEASELGYAEPGEGSPVDKMRGELKDTDYKAAILTNVGEFCEAPVNWDIFSPGTEPDEESLLHVFRSPSMYQHVTSFYRSDSKELDRIHLNDVIAGSIVDLGGWVAVKGFRRLGQDSTLDGFTRLDPGPTAMLKVVQILGKTLVPRSIVGHGAGPDATAHALYEDLRNIS